MTQRNLKAELQAKHDAIRTVPIPAMIAGIFSTQELRANIDAYCTALQAYIDGLGMQVTSNCAELEGEEAKNCYLTTLEAYGIVVTGDFSIEQLAIIFNAVHTLGSRLSDELQRCELGNYTPEQAFRAVYKTDNQQIEFVYQPCAEEPCTEELANPRSAETQELTLVLPAEQFILTGRDTNIDMQWLIIHELGHVFHNLFDDCANQECYLCYQGPGDVVYIGNNAELQNECARNGFTIRIRSVPTIVVEFLQATGGYWTAGDYDFGLWRTEGRFRAEDAARDANIQLATTSNYLVGENVCAGQGEGPFLVNQNGRPQVIGENQCIPSSQAGNYPDETWYFRRGVYIPHYQRLPVPTTMTEDEYRSEVVNRFFRNENRTDNPNPYEGFADTFAVYMRYGPERLAEILGDDPRVDFIRDRICRWLNLLINANSQ